MNENFGVWSVLPMGVRQQAAYQRSSPFEERRMHRKES